MFSLKVIITLAAWAIAVQAGELDSWYTGYRLGGLKKVHSAGAVGKYHNFEEAGKDYSYYHDEHDNKHDLVGKAKDDVAKDHPYYSGVGTKTYNIKIVKDAKDGIIVKDVKEVIVTKDVKDTKKVEDDKVVKVAKDVMDAATIKEVKAVEVAAIVKDSKSVKVAEDVKDAKDLKAVTTDKNVHVITTVKPHVEQMPSIDIRSLNSDVNHKSGDNRPLTVPKVKEPKVEEGKGLKDKLNADRSKAHVNYGLDGNKVETDKQSIDDQRASDHKTGHKEVHFTQAGYSVKENKDVYQVPVGHYLDSHKASYGIHHEFIPTHAYDEEFSLEGTYHGYKSPFKSSHSIPLGNKDYYNYDKYDGNHGEASFNHNYGKKVFGHYQDYHEDHAVDKFDKFSPYWSY